MPLCRIDHARVVHPVPRRCFPSVSWPFALVLATTLAATTLAPAHAATAKSATMPTAVFEHSVAMEGLLPVHVDKNGGRILVTLPAAGDDGVSARFLYATALRTGLGSAPTFLDRGRIGQTQVIAFRRYGTKVAAMFENPRFRGAGAGDAASPDFATSIVWMGDIAATLPDGEIVVDLSGFLASDTLGIADALDQSGDTFGVGGAQGAGKDFALDGKLSAADPASVKSFPDNLEIDAVQTFTSKTPGDEVENIAPEPKKVSLTVHHSFVRLPGPGFHARAFDPRIGGFGTQAVEFGTPLGGDVVREFANRFRLEKIDPDAARSKVRKPIVFYVDWHAPEPIRSALIEGIGWWSKAFDAAGYIDAFQVKLLPKDIDPMDVRYNVVNWVDRATRGWSYGQEIVDPRTGEIVKGMVVLGSLRVRQDIQIFEGLVGADKIDKGGPNDPAQVALARLRQLGAHEVGHALGFAHNFAASTQERASVMDYPPPRIGLVDGRPDLGDAYATGIGRWDMATVDWLYSEPATGQDPQAAADAKASADVAAGMRYIEDANARADDTAQPWASLWDDGADPTAELVRLMKVRRAAIDHFGLASLEPGEPMADLPRRFVPVWLLHRYQVVAATKAIGGVDLAYAVNGGGNEASTPVPPQAQRAALDAVLGTLLTDQLRVPERLLPLLSAARNGSPNRQYEIELFDGPGGPVFDPLVAADTAAEVTLNALLAPARLARLDAQHAVDPNALGVDELLDRLLATTLPDHTDAVSRRIAFRTLITLAQVAHRPATTPGVAARLDQRVHDVALALAQRHDSSEDRAWAASLSRQLLDPQQLDKLLSERPRTVTVPPGAPIGGEGDWMEMPGEE
ncbi:MAG TPA: zinc-dependent metalloprotease [Xanthomonadaceae bacterium]|nr:zinc-dependent metalloprotease [Xanthomonadaceae bacterium]